MVTFTKNSIDLSVKADKTNLAGKFSSELYKTVSSKAASKSDDFKNVLSSKTNFKEEETKKIYNSNKIDESEEKPKVLEEDSKSDSKDDIKSILNELLNLLSQLGIKEEDLKSDGEINSSNIIGKLMELLKNDSAKDSLSGDYLKSIEKLLGNLSANLADDNTEAKSGIKNLISEMSNMLNANQNEDKKVLTLEDMLNKNYSQDDKESSDENKNNNTATSKEDKFLNSLIDDKDSSLDKINLFASRTAAVQNQGDVNAKGLTINKATFTNDLIKDIKFMNNNSLKELIVKVNPGNLGEITIKLVQENDIMKASLKANSKETAALLSQNLTDIKKQLVEQNIKIEDVKIELYQEDTTFFRGQGFGRQLSEEQGRRNSSSSNSSNDGVIIEEESIGNIASDNSNIVEVFV